MKTSAPNKWAYGGVLLRMRWSEAESGLLQLWNGTVVEVRHDDTLTMLQTGSPEPVFVGVEHTSGREA